MTTIIKPSVAKLVTKFNNARLIGEDNAMAYWSNQGWSLNNYRGGNGISFTRAGWPDVAIYRGTLSWCAEAMTVN